MSFNLTFLQLKFYFLKPRKIPTSLPLILSAVPLVVP